MRSLRIDRFMRLPRRSGEVWQGGGVLLPFFASSEHGGQPVRQAAIAWANLATDEVVLVDAPVVEYRDFQRALDLLVDFGLKSRKVREGRPMRIEVQDAELGAFISDALGDRELEVEVVPTLTRIDEELARIVREETDATVPGVLEARGVDLARLRAFADAAGRFHTRQIWHDLGPDDFVIVEAPAAADGMAGFVVRLDEGVPTVEFHASREEFERQQNGETDLDDDSDDGLHAEDGFDAAPSLWRVEFVHLHELPAADVSVWADLGLPVAASDAYPAVTRQADDIRFERPDAARLAFLEGVLRALAETSEDEIDSGRWSKDVETADGPVTCRLAMPSLLDEHEGGDPTRRASEEAGALLWPLFEERDFATLEDALEEARSRGIGRSSYREPTEPSEKALDLFYRSMGVPTRRRKQLLRQALSVWPGCFRALLGLAESETRDDRALDLFVSARAAAEQSIGRERLDAMKGRYWEDLQTRQYLRIGMGLAMALERLRRPAEAAAELRELLVLDDTDRIEARTYLLALLLDTDRHEEAVQLLEERDHADASPAWAYGRALLAYRLHDPQAAQRLDEARLASTLTAALLVTEVLGVERATGILPKGWRAAPEDQEEAEDAVELLSSAWQATPGAAEWLAAGARRPQRRGGKRRPGRRR